MAGVRSQFWDQVTVFLLGLLTIDLGLAELYLIPDHFSVTLPLQSVYIREVDEEELEAETALRERDERIRELEMVIMKQVDIAILTTSMCCFRFCSNDGISWQKWFAVDIHYCQAQDMAQMKQHVEILSKEQDGPATDWRKIEGNEINFFVGFQNWGYGISHSEEIIHPCIWYAAMLYISQKE